MYKGDITLPLPSPGKLFIACCAFTVLKLTALPQMSWWIVTMPLWAVPVSLIALPIMLGIGAVGIAVLLGLRDYYINRDAHRRRARYYRSKRADAATKE